MHPENWGCPSPGPLQACTPQKIRACSQGPPAHQGESGLVPEASDSQEHIHQDPRTPSESPRELCKATQHLEVQKEVAVGPGLERWPGFPTESPHGTQHQERGAGPGCS